MKTKDFVKDLFSGFTPSNAEEDYAATVGLATAVISGSVLAPWLQHIVKQAGTGHVHDDNGSCVLVFAGDRPQIAVLRVGFGTRPPNVPNPGPGLVFQVEPAILAGDNLWTAVDRAGVRQLFDVETALSCAILWLVEVPLVEAVKTSGATMETLRNGATVKILLSDKISLACVDDDNMMPGSVRFELSLVHPDSGERVGSVATPAVITNPDAATPEDVEFVIGRGDETFTAKGYSAVTRAASMALLHGVLRQVMRDTAASPL